MTKQMRDITGTDNQNSSWPSSIDDVLEAYTMADEGPSLRTLTKWLARYPQYAEELTAFTAQWALVKHLPDVIDADETDQEKLVLRGMSIIQEALFAASQQRAVSPELSAKHSAAQLATTSDVPSQGNDLSARPFRGLLTEGQLLGFDIDTLADRIEIFSGSLLTKLDRCLIEHTTIPRNTIDNIATIFHRHVSTIHEYFAGQPNFSPAMQHRASQAPSLPSKKISFLDAVKHDPELTEEQRNDLIALI